MGGDTVTTVGPDNLAGVKIRKPDMNPLGTAVRILKEFGFKNLIEVGATGSGNGIDALMLIGDFPLNGETAEAYLRAKSEILNETKLELFAYERIKNDRVYVSVT